MTPHDRFFDLSCAEAQESVSAILDGEADMAEEAATRRHIQTCQTCRAFERDLLAMNAKIEAESMRPGDGAGACRPRAVPWDRR